MRFELGLEEPDPARAGRSAATIRVLVYCRRLVPLAPYILDAGNVDDPHFGSHVSVTLLALLYFRLD